MMETSTTKKWAVAAALALGLAAAAARSQGEDGPAAYPLSRYEGLWKNSLFGSGEKAEPVAEAEAPTNLALVGVFEVDGVEHAVLMDTANGMTEEVNSVRANAGGSRLAKIESSPELMKTRVQVERGGALVWVGYDLAASTKSAAQQTKAERLRALQEKQKLAMAARPEGDGGGAGGVVDGGGEEAGDTGQPETKAERPRTVVLPSTIPQTARQE